MPSTGAIATLATPRTLRVRELMDPTALPFRLELLAGEDGLDRLIAHPRIQKSGLALVGHFEGVASERVQIVGQTEISFLLNMDPAARVLASEGFYTPGFACAIVTCSGPTPPELLAGATRARCALFASPVKSSTTINALHALLDEKLAPRTRIHGVLVDVYGVGLLLQGRSGIGKSECALELVQRGHRLIADDMVDCALRPPDFVFGEATQLLRNHLEVRGLGVLNIKDLFGVASVRERKRIDLVIRLLSHDEDEWDRLGVDDEWHEILGVKVPVRRVPVRPGKSTVSTVEVAARNELLRQAGHHSAREFHARLAAALGVVDPSTLSPAGAQPQVLSVPRPLSEAPPPLAMSSLPPEPPSGATGRGGGEK